MNVQEITKMNDESIMPYNEFCEKLSEFLQLYHVVAQVTCPQIILLKRDEIKEELRESFCDMEDNLTRWVKSRPCVFVHPETHNHIAMVIGKNPETLYHFLIFCRDINMKGKVNEEHKTYLAYLLAKMK